MTIYEQQQYRSGAIERDMGIVMERQLSATRRVEAVETRIGNLAVRVTRLETFSKLLVGAVVFLASHLGNITGEGIAKIISLVVKAFL